MKEYQPVKGGLDENDIKNMKIKIGKPDINKFKKITDGVWHGEFAKFGEKSVRIFDILNHSKKPEYKAPSTSLENLEKMYFEEEWSHPPVYGSNIHLSLINSDDFHFGNLDTILRYVQKMVLML